MARGRGFERHQRQRAIAAAAKAEAERPAPRPEAEIMAELAPLCRTPGFAHVIAHVVVRDNFVIYRDEMTPADMHNLYGFSRLNRPEVATLIGFMVQSGADVFGPPPEESPLMLNRIELLLEELHRALMGAEDSIEAYLERQESGEALREPIFYGAESAFSFQYRDFAPDKYGNDADWLTVAKGFTIAEACEVADIIVALQEAQVSALIREPQTGEGGIWSPLSGFLFDRTAIDGQCVLPEERITAILDAFSTPIGGNGGFASLHDLNRAAIAPLISLGEGKFALFQQYSLFEALYEAPFYWMFDDKAYRDTAAKNRGDFTEAFTERRLKNVFGEERVHRGLRLFRAKGAEIGEIDILVEFGGRLLLVQAKSKRLTMKARGGDDAQLRIDFEGAVQSAYDQAVSCAEAMLDPAIEIIGTDGKAVKLASAPTKIYPFCLVSDHYPALVAHTDHFLTKRTVANVAAPIITDIFALDALCELLDRPLRFLNYCELRDRFGERLIYSHEMILLSEHVKRNLWVDEKYDSMMLDDNVGTHIEIAMTARRRGVPGAKTPKGPLTFFAGSLYDKAIARIESQPEPPMVDMGLFLLEASGASVKAFNAGAEMICEQVQRDMRLHDFTLSIGGTGLTVHSSFEKPSAARRMLEAHSEAKKYNERTDRWYGMFLDPSDGLPVAALCLRYPWVYDPEAAKLGAIFPGRQQNAQLPRALRGKAQGARFASPGRNAPCSCGSGRKTKRCCGAI